MRKVIPILAVLALLVSFAGCDKQASGGQGPSADHKASAPKNNGKGKGAVHAVKGGVGQTMDLGDESVAVTNAYISKPNPADGAGGHYDGTFLLVTFAAEARATARASEASLDSLPPKAALMKGPEVLQAQNFSGAQWFYYRDGRWQGSVYDNFGRYTFPKAVVLKKGTRLHVRIFKPERPNVQVNSHTRKGKYGLPTGPNQPLEHTFKRVERNGETYAWDVFFRVGQSKHNYYTVIHTVWEKQPGTHISYGDADYAFHVKTR